MVEVMKKKIEEYCHSLGLDTLGFLPCRRMEELIPYYEKRKEKKLQNEFEEKDIEKRINPMLSMPEAKTIISIAFPYLDSYENSANGFSVYTKRVDYHRVVNSYLSKIASFIEGLGGKAQCYVDSNALPERYLAYLAGVGFIGRNNMLITKKYGSYVFLGEILTDLEIECCDQRTLEEKYNYIECGECTQCLLECPTKSIHTNGCNPNICLSYLTQKKELTEKEMNLLRGNVFGCDFCQLKCPYNEKAEFSALEEFRKLDYMEEPIETFANMNNSYFKEKVSMTSCGWRGKNVIRRNAIIHMKRKGLEINQFTGDSEYINAYIRRLNDEKENL